MPWSQRRHTTPEAAAELGLVDQKEPAHHYQFSADLKRIHVRC